MNFIKIIKGHVKTIKLIMIFLILITIILLATPTIYVNLVYEKNQDGETFGKAAEKIDKSGFLRDPDLIEMIADNGKKGYVKKTDYCIPQPNNPKEALIYMEKFSAISVYRNDGVTKIGEINLNNTTGCL